ncbi:MAG TPA: hypothetical protein DCE00_05630 [Firmicutes bacterium]|nr:hypothetical protein [Bacillota bacterium]HAA38335.1 hypothetical protein [Bacillota bacterium]
MTFEALSTIVVLAIIVEFTTEIVKTIFPVIRGQYSRLVAILLGITLCLITRSGLLAIFQLQPVVFPQIDYFITGLIISRGSNILHDLVSKLNMANVKS